MPHAEVNSQRLYYEVHGEGEPLFCVMGLSADTVAWALQVQAFSQNHQMVIFDNRDAGQSSRAEPGYDTADMARDALGLADHLELDSYHLLGVSMGGAIAQEMALAAPERVRTLTLVVTFAEAGAYGPERARIWGATVMRSPREEHVSNLMLLTLSQDFYENAEAVEFVRNMMLSNPHPQEPEAFVRQLTASTSHNAADRLPSLDMPVHVIGAEHDILVPVWKSQEIAELIPGARLSVIPRAAHALQIERAEDYNRTVLDFLAEHAAEPAAA